MSNTARYSPNMVRKVNDVSVFRESFSDYVIHYEYHFSNDDKVINQDFETELLISIHNFKFFTR